MKKGMRRTPSVTSDTLMVSFITSCISVTRHAVAARLKQIRSISHLKPFGPFDQRSRIALQTDLDVRQNVTFVHQTRLSFTRSS